MPAVPSDNPLHAEMNRNYNIHVWEWSEARNEYLHAGINSANEVSAYIGNEEIKIRLFNEVLNSGADQCTKLIRKRLRLKFYSK